MPINSRAKGKVGELEARNMLRDVLGCADAKRGQQRSGLEQADVVDAIPGVHIEVKRRKALAVREFMNQACNDAKMGETPMVMMREDRGDWLVMVRLGDLYRLCESVAAIKGKPIFPHGDTETRRQDANSDEEGEAAEEPIMVG